MSANDSACRVLTGWDETGTGPRRVVVPVLDPLAAIETAAREGDERYAESVLRALDLAGYVVVAGASLDDAVDVLAEVINQPRSQGPPSPIVQLRRALWPIVRQLRAAARGEWPPPTGKDVTA